MHTENAALVTNWGKSVITAPFAGMQTEHSDLEQFKIIKLAIIFLHLISTTHLPGKPAFWSWPTGVGQEPCPEGGYKFLSDPIQLSPPQTTCYFPSILMRVMILEPVRAS